MVEDHKDMMQVLAGQKTTVPGREWRILIVDDSAEDRLLYRRMIAQWTDRQCIVSESGSGEEGLDLVDSEKPDCILLDCNLPDIDGHRFLTKLAGEGRNSGVAVVMLSDAVPEAVTTAGMKRETHDYLAKGVVNSGNLYRAVAEAIEVGPFRQELADGKEELRRSQLLASIPSLLIGIAEDDRIDECNRAAAEIFGVAATALVGKPLKEVGIPWDSAVILRAVAECRVNGKVIRIDVHYGQPAGGEGLLGLSFNPLSGKDVKGSGVLILGAEITERRALESQLAHAHKLESIGQLAAGIAHEINTPTQYVGDNTRFLQEAFADLATVLTTWRGLTETPPGEPASPDLMNEAREVMQRVDLDYLTEEIPRAIQQSLEGIERVAKIVYAMKEFSHPAKDKTLIDINSAIETTITVARNEWKYVADVVTDFDPDLPLVPCLPGDFNQAILNFIVNAAHAIGDAVGDGAQGKGTITVGTQLAGDWAEIRITDTGAGIPEDIKGRIFEPFFTTKGVGKGTGQGLSMAHAFVVQKLGGTITVDTKVGKGTSFITRLPVVDPAGVPEKAMA